MLRPDSEGSWILSKTIGFITHRQREIKDLIRNYTLTPMPTGICAVRSQGVELGPERSYRENILACEKSLFHRQAATKPEMEGQKAGAALLEPMSQAHLVEGGRLLTAQRRLGPQSRCTCCSGSRETGGRYPASFPQGRVRAASHWPILPESWEARESGKCSSL